MPLAIRCERCGKSQSAPDSLVGEPIICSYCGHRVIVPADAPLMPPPLPGSAPPNDPHVAAPPTSAIKAIQHATAPPPLRPPAARPPSRSVAPTSMSYSGTAPAAAPPPAPPPVSPPPIPPPAFPSPAFSQRTEPLLQVYDRASKLQRTSIWPWIAAGVVGFAILIVVIVAVVRQQVPLNPPLSSIKDKLEADPKALAILSPRQTGLGYSLQLPSDFVPVAPPPTDGLLAGTQSFAWGAKPGTEGEGSLCRIWVMPKSLNIEQELHDLQGLGGLLDHQVSIKNKSSYYRLGENMLTVRGLLEGIDSATIRKGVIYLIVDGRQTIMVVGMATGPNVSQLQTLLNHAIRTIQRVDTAPSRGA